MTSRSTFAPTLWLLLLTCASPAFAAPLWQKLVPSQRVEADPNADYHLTENLGPWFVLATTFSGETAEDRARELVLELRSRYKLEAYLYEMTFDFSQTLQGRGVDPTGQPQRMRYQRDEKLREIAVLIGNYNSVDDPAAQETLRQVKFMRPETFTRGKPEETNETVGKYRDLLSKFTRNEDRKKKGPMAMAFVTRNPLMSQEFFVPKGIDAFVEKINSDVKYSLLQCQGQYSVKVATFNGKVVIDQSEVNALTSGRKQLDSQLEHAGETAERMTIALRKKGYEAYVLHDRGASIVTVGSFTELGNRNAEGKIELDPRIHRVIETFQAAPATSLTTSAGAASQAAFKLKSIVKIPFDIQPEIVQVPHRSIATDYTQRPGF